ncbi:MAG: HEAT repeat domain-containing protein [Myxococcales bacterium]
MSAEKLWQGLADVDPEVRRRAVLLSAEMQDPELGEPLMKALGDSDWRVRKEAVQVSIARAQQFDMIEALVRAICQGENVGLRNAALDVLETLGQVAAPALIAALPNVPEHARKFVVEALGESGGIEVVEELAKAAVSEDVNVAGEAIEALAHIQGPAAERVLRQRLTASDAFLRMAALDALNRRDVSIPWPELEPLLKERLLRRVVLSALGRTGSVDALEPLFAALEESTLHIVASAALALARLIAHGAEIEEAARPRLLQLSERARAWLRGVLASGTDTEARRAATELLVRSQDVDGLAAVVAYLAHEAPSAQIVEALRSWGAQSVEPLLLLLPRFESAQERALALELAADLAIADENPNSSVVERARVALRRALSDRESAVLLAALRCFPQWAQAEDAAPLVGHAQSQDGNVARAAARALEALAERAPEAVERALSGVDLDGPQGAVLSPVVATLGGSRALDLLQVLNAVDDREVRRAALLGLGRVGGERAAGLVALALADEDVDVQIVAAQVLGRIRDEQGGSPGVFGLVNAISSEFPHVRTAVARALGQTNSPRAAAPLMELLRDADAGVAMTAVEALGQLNPSELAHSLQDALTHADSEVVKAALRALSSCLDPAAPEQLIAALRHPAWDVRKLSGELLEQLAVAHAREPLQQALEHETDDLAREALSRALTSLEGPR